MKQNKQPQDYTILLLGIVFVIALLSSCANERRVSGNCPLVNKHYWYDVQGTKPYKLKKY
jgi:hypothetical protein